MLPVFELEGSWFFRGLNLDLIGPYGDRERAETKYTEYCAYVVDAPDCHHP